MKSFLEKNTEAFGTTETATFSMGCFWRPDALFGSLNNVLRTQVGYTGGSSENPGYRNMADHIETVQMEFHPEKGTYTELLDIFFSNHKPGLSPWKRQYSSAIFYHNQTQKELATEARAMAAEQIKQEIYTSIYPFQHFYPAEERHQKYKLQRQPLLMAELTELFPSFNELVNSTTAARMNGHLYGYGKKEDFETLLHNLGISAHTREEVLKMVIPTKVVHCTA